MCQAFPLRLSALQDNPPVFLLRIRIRVQAELRIIFRQGFQNAFFHDDPLYMIDFAFSGIQGAFPAGTATVERIGLQKKVYHKGEAADSG